MDERGYKTKIKNLLENEGFFVLNTYDPSRPGIPDIYACYRGISFWLELKWTEKYGAISHPLTSPQSKFLRDINLYDGVGLVVVGSPKGHHHERIERVGKRNKFDWDFKSDDEFVEALCLKAEMAISTAQNLYDMLL